MGKLDDFLSKAKTVANVAGKKTGEMVELSKLKLQAVQLNADIQKAHERLGAIVYEQEKTGSDNSDLVQVCVSEVDALLVSLNELNSKIAEAQNTAKCPNCGAVNAESSVFCTRCGSNLNDAQPSRPVVAQADATPVEECAPQTENDEENK